MTIAPAFKPKSLIFWTQPSFPIQHFPPSRIKPEINKVSTFQITVKNTMLFTDRQ